MSLAIPEHSQATYTGLTPSSLNAISEADLAARVTAAIDGDGVVLAPFITAAVLSRVRALVWKRGLDECGGWGKQRMLAWMTATLTGGRRPSWEDAETPGNAADAFITRHRVKVQKAMNQHRTC
mmetsp:Transcript_16741/g.39963  ORF Transcript_16741/g.39963 Transcript_16741/m.39963 type:complete len:124 (-) Transcript_16741:215-586(-)